MTDLMTSKFITTQNLPYLGSLWWGYSVYTHVLYLCHFLKICCSAMLHHKQEITFSFHTLQWNRASIGHNLPLQRNTCQRRLKKLWPWTLILLNCSANVLAPLCMYLPRIVVPFAVSAMTSRPTTIIPTGFTFDWAIPIADFGVQLRAPLAPLPGHRERVGSPPARTGRTAATPVLPHVAVRFAPQLVVNVAAVEVTQVAIVTRTRITPMRKFQYSRHSSLK